MKRIRGATTNEQHATSNEQRGICFLDAAGICGAELDLDLDLADGAGNGRVRKPTIRTIKTSQNLSQANKVISEVNRRLADFDIFSPTGIAVRFSGSLSDSRWFK